MRAWITLAMVLVVPSCSKLLGISDPITGDATSGGGERPDNPMPDAMVDSSIDAPPPCAAANTFGSEATFDVGATGVAFAVATLDPGGNLDVAVAVSTGVTILHGDGAGTFANPTTIATPAIGVAIEDFNTDARNDLILWAGDSITTQLQDNANPGTFLAPEALPGTFANVKNAIADFFDGAFRPDLIVQDDNGRRVFLSNASGTFSTTAQNVGSAGDDLVVVTNVDDQGRNDVVMVDGSGNIKLSVAVGNTGLDTAKMIGSGATGRAVGFGKFSDDTLPDMMIATAAGGVLFTQNANGTFTQQPGTIPGIIGDQLFVSDINKDGTDDIVVPGSIVMQCPGTPGVFTQVESVSSVAPATLVDINKDGKIDLLRLVGNNLVVRLQ